MPGSICAVPNTAVDTEDARDIGRPGRDAILGEGLAREADSLVTSPIGRLYYPIFRQKQTTRINGTRHFMWIGAHNAISCRLLEEPEACAGAPASGRGPARLFGNFGIQNTGSNTEIDLVW